jgi:hypothetical protein
MVNFNSLTWKLGVHKDGTISTVMVHGEGFYGNGFFLGEVYRIKPGYEESFQKLLKFLEEIEKITDKYDFDVYYTPHFIAQTKEEAEKIFNEIKEIIMSLNPIRTEEITTEGCKYFYGIFNGWKMKIALYKDRQNYNIGFVIHNTGFAGLV